MSNTNTGGPAFPAPRIICDSNGCITGFSVDSDGMTLRDYFAAKAMQTILPQYENVFDDDTASEGDPSFPELLAKDAYVMADAMLKARQE